MQRLRLSSIAMVAVLWLSACASGDDEPATGEASTAAPSAESPASGTTSPALSEATASPQESTAATVGVRIAGERVTPNAEQVDVTVGETLVFEIVSDRPGELHVHSKPEQFVEFGEGRTRAEISIRTPGSVKVEEHDTSAVVAIVEVR